MVNATIIKKGGYDAYFTQFGDSIAMVHKDSIRRKSDNGHLMDIEGINHVVVEVRPNGCHIARVSGWTHHAGLFCVDAA